jgi:glycerate kinase
MADGGEGLLDVVGGRRRRARARDAQGRPVDASWSLVDDTAVIESAQAIGLALVGGPEGNDPMRASSAGVGDIVNTALLAGAHRIVVGLGGSATTDGGLGCVTALEPHGRLRGVDLLVACDVQTTFVEAAEVFAPQKGATEAQVALLRRRLERLAQVYSDRFGVDVRHLPGSGAAGGLAGGLAALGATLVPGVEVVADQVGLPERLEGADLVVTGEGFLDEQSLAGKVVGGVAELARDAGVPVLVVVGEVLGDVAQRIDGEVVSLVERFGRERSYSDTASCIEEVVAGSLSP